MVFKFDLLRQKRKELKLPQELVADYLSLTRNSIINMEKGRHNPTLKDIYKLCCLYNIQPNDLFIEVVPVKIETETVTIIKTREVKKLKQKIIL